MKRLHLVHTWQAPPVVPELPGVTTRPMSAEDGEVLGSLFWLGFDDEDAYESPGAARTEADESLAGVWGPVTWDACFVACAEGDVVAASVVVSDDAHDGSPLLAFAVTLPGWRRRGIGRALILESLRALHEQGVRELHLAVLPDNTARSLYTALGFVEVTAQTSEA